MKQINLQYLGKKSPMHLNNNQLSCGYVFGCEPVWVLASDAEWLMQTNPKMFARIGERQLNAPDVETATPEPETKTEAPVAENKPVETAPNFSCEKCGTTFKVEWAYKRHMLRCGKEE